MCTLNKHPFGKLIPPWLFGSICVLNRLVCLFNTVVFIYYINYRNCYPLIPISLLPPSLDREWKFRMLEMLPSSSSLSHISLFLHISPSFSFRCSPTSLTCSRSLNNPRLAISASLEGLLPQLFSKRHSPNPQAFQSYPWSTHSCFSIPSSNWFCRENYLYTCSKWLGVGLVDLVISVLK